MRFASSTSVESRLMFQAIRNGRAPDRHRARARVHAPGPEVGLAARLEDRALESLVLARADVGQPDALGTEGRVGVEVDGDPVLLRHPPAEVPRERDRVRHRDAGQRNERDDVDRADPRMDARCGAPCRCLDGHRDRPLHRRRRGVRRPGEREHAPVVVHVAGSVEQVDAGHGRDRGGQPIDHVGPAALAEVRHELDQGLLHVLHS